MASVSSHPLSKVLVRHFESSVSKRMKVDSYSETPGMGISGLIEGVRVQLGSAAFTGHPAITENKTSVFVNIGSRPMGYFIFTNHYRPFIPRLVKDMEKDFSLSVLSGDNNAEKQNLEKILGREATLLFDQKPEDKLAYIQQLQKKGHQVMMIGDGLNDAGALKQANAGIAVSDESNNFTPASDAILEAPMLPKLPQFIRLCRANRQIVISSFILSIAYNVIGIFFAVQGKLSPLTAAILMPSSTLSIILLTFGSSALLAKKMRL